MAEKREASSGAAAEEHHLQTSPGIPSGPGDFAGGKRLRQGASSGVDIVGEPAKAAEAGLRGLAWVCTAWRISWSASGWVVGLAETLA